MPISRHSHHPRHAAVEARDGALRRLSFLNRFAVTGAVALAVGFSALAAKATPAKHRAAVVVPAQTTSSVPAARAAAPSTSDDAPRHRRHHRHVQAAPAPVQSAPAVPAPAPTPQPPVVVSGGS